MRLAIISDIHGNMEALNQVLIDIHRSRVDGICCLGDIIGYGPDPEEAATVIRGRNIPTVIGNHELAIADPEQLSWFNPFARISLEKSAKMLSEETINYISGLAFSRVIDQCRLTHGFPPDSPITYLTFVSAAELHIAFTEMTERICFVGHTHKLEIIDFDGKEVRRYPLSKGIESLSRDKQYIVNIGSVGQPRDGNNNAKYAIWDSAAYTIEPRYIPYNIKKVADKIVALGLPSMHARKLW